MDDSSSQQRLRIAVQPMPHQSQVREAGEDWAGVTSTDQRRKLQNRLNQRARRRRKRLGTDAHPSTSCEAVRRLIASAGLKSPEELIQMDHDQAARKWSLARQLADQAYAEYLAKTPRPEHLLRVVQINVFHALARNAVALGLSTSWLLYDSISPFGQIGPPIPVPAPPSYPDSLTPTPLQASEPHHPWVDLLPWPVLRDRILHLSAGDLLDEDDLCHDIVELDTTLAPSEKAALIVWGAPWDPSGWEATPAFLQKWGWLLENCDEILQATNYWREKRGEEKLSFRPFRTRNSGV
ncbi:hypothetical protein CONLIGDRAFT_633258 [Coniochaeta ligniaria NRRL 30616]|uniref:BZIP domain-containing protein n=1 Tax=Coniochaeta ligniaria NRRL 30616 TaxID=1408157 RepID=A0A1J7JIF8_9PEZI|nr:hypothetical protein CONLIGDRAFT_633258 [Coniochaeta ligniaria NRRL 30616]